MTDQTPAVFCGLGQASSPSVQILVKPSAEFNKNCLSFSSLIFLCPLLLSPSYSVLEDYSPLSKRTLQHKWYNVSSSIFLFIPSRHPVTSVPVSPRLCLLSLASLPLVYLQSNYMVLYISFSLLWDYFCRAERVGCKDCLLYTSPSPRDS